MSVWSAKSLQDPAKLVVSEVFLRNLWQIRDYLTKPEVYLVFQNTSYRMREALYVMS